MKQLELFENNGFKTGMFNSTSDTWNQNVMNYVVTDKDKKILENSEVSIRNLNQNLQYKPIKKRSRKYKEVI
jgi:hypothetical protein